jgi:hypothetical protein
MSATHHLTLLLGHKQTDLYRHYALDTVHGALYHSRLSPFPSLMPSHQSAPLFVLRPATWLEMRGVMGQLDMPRMTWMITEKHWQNNYTDDKTEVLGGKTYFLATSSTTRCTQTALELNPGLRDEKRATNCPRWTTILTPFTALDIGQ